MAWKAPRTALPHRWTFARLRMPGCEAIVPHKGRRKEDINALDVEKEREKALKQIIED